MCAILMNIQDNMYKSSAVLANFYVLSKHCSAERPRPAARYAPYCDFLIYLCVETLVHVALKPSRRLAQLLHGLA